MIDVPCLPFQKLFEGISRARRVIADGANLYRQHLPSFPEISEEETQGLDDVRIFERLSVIGELKDELTLIVSVGMGMTMEQNRDFEHVEHF